MITKGNKVNFYYTSKGTTEGTDSTGILFDGQNLEIHTHDKVFKGTDTNTWRNLLVDSSAKATNDTSSGGLNIVSGDDIAIEWLEPGQGSGYSGSADWSSLRISTSGLDDMAMLSPDDSCTYGADTSHGGSSTFNRFAQSWRPIKIDNEELLDLDSSAPLNLLAGEGIELDASGSNVYINFSGDVENGAYLLEDDGSAIIPGFDAENNTVHLTPQTLSSGQMQQARSNIGALSTDSLTGYATEIWVGEQGYVTDVSYLESKIGIVASSSATVNAEVGKYYRYDEPISSLTVNLPSVSEATTLQKIMIYFQAGASNALTLSSTDDIQYMNGYDIESGSTYEVTIMWNGYSWIVTLMEIEWLPAGAKKIAYIQSSGTQWINTQYIPTTNTKAEMSCNITPYTQYDTPFGSRTSPNSGSFLIFARFSSNNNAYYDFGNGEAVIGADESNYGNDITISLSNTQVIFGNKSVSYSKTLSSSYPIYLFNLNQSNAVYSGNVCACVMKLYSFKIYENGSLIHNFIPIRIGQIGYLFDKITKQTFSNSGTGNFILGNDI